MDRGWWTRGCGPVGSRTLGNTSLGCGDLTSSAGQSGFEDLPFFRDPPAGMVAVRQSSAGDADAGRSRRFAGRPGDSAIVATNVAVIAAKTGAILSHSRSSAWQKSR
jgi:hypothetical protein